MFNHYAPAHLHGRVNGSLRRHNVCNVSSSDTEMQERAKKGTNRWSGSAQLRITKTVFIQNVMIRLT